MPSRPGRAAARATQPNGERVPVIEASHPNGHFYSPVTDPAELKQRADQIWPTHPDIVGIEFNDASHHHLLTEVFPRYLRDYNYPESLQETPDLTRFFTQNSQFSWLDARALFVLLRHWQPRRMIEVGSGFSSLLVADVNHRYLNNMLDFTCIEPYPRAFLTNGIPGITRLIPSQVQDVALDTFTELSDGDVLFIDSSHVSKTGSDVNHLYFEVLPRLAPGVRVHIHDIFLPHDYPRDWVLGENRSWNEQYLLRALLTHSSGYQVLFGSNYAHTHYPDLVRNALALPSRHTFGGGSFWIQRTHRDPRKPRNWGRNRGHKP